MLTKPCAHATTVRDASSTESGAAIAPTVRNRAANDASPRSTSGRHASGSGRNSSPYAAGCAWANARNAVAIAARSRAASPVVAAASRAADSSPATSIEISRTSSARPPTRL